MQEIEDIIVSTLGTIAQDHEIDPSVHLHQVLGHASLSRVLNMKFLKYASKWALVSHNFLSGIINIGEAVSRCRAMQRSHLVIDRAASVGASLRPRQDGVTSALQKRAL